MVAPQEGAAPLVAPVQAAAPLVAPVPQNCFWRWIHKTTLRELPSHLRWSYGYFALCLILLIGSQGFIFPVRTSLFYDIIENKYCDVPRCPAAAQKDAFAKALLPVVQLPCVIGFNTLWGKYKNPRLMILLVCSLFTALFVPVYVGLVTGANQDIQEGVYTHNELWLAYLTYYSVELKAVICPVMIWCVVNDLTPPKIAKIAYGPIVFAVQIGTVIGAFMAGQVTWFGGNSGLVLIQVICLLLAIFCGLRGVSIFKSGTIPDAYLEAPAPDAENAGNQAPQVAVERESCARSMYSGVEGIWLILTHPYLLATAWCSVAHLVPRLFLDFQGTQVVNNFCNVHYYDTYDTCKTSSFGWVNITQSILTMLLALVGTRKIVEYGGLRLGLSVLPIFAIIGNLATFLTLWSLGAKLADGGLLPNLWITQISIIAMNTFGYGLNGPSREMLYVKATRNMKYKAKSWSDMYGNSGMKSLASIINAYFNSNGHPSAILTSAIASGWVVVWLGIVQWVGLKHKSLMKTGKVIGEEGEGRLCH
jgi:ATP/ADP translocase